MSSEHLLTIRGTMSIRERIAPAPGAVATVKLVDNAGEVLAAGAVAARHVPLEFALDVDPYFAADPSKLLIWAALRSDTGVWGTTELVPVEEGSTEVRLTRIDT